MRDSSQKLPIIATVMWGMYLVLTCCETTPVGIRINRGESIPSTLFLSKKMEKVRELKREGFVSFSHPKSAKKLVKQVVGLPGDVIQFRDQNVFVNGRDCGRPLNKENLSPVEEGVIPDGYTYVYAPHEESFDSRYREFGLVKIDDIEEELCSVF